LDEGFITRRRYNLPGAKIATSFEWDPQKALADLLKHQVAFGEAGSIFDDPQFITFLDDEHSQDEERYISIGLSNKNRILLHPA